MKYAHDIILKPIITEASMVGAANEDGARKYTFAVAKGANKPEIAKAVEELFKVKV
jgi:large subunit ribosomal protein L23